MDSKCQIFISSTYNDLQDIRLNLINVLYAFGYEPIGMEYFSASDEEQFEYVKRIIRKVDFYILIVAGSYGSVSDDGLSYTEKEYDFALKNNKSILVYIENYNTEKYDDIRLETFINKVSKNRIIACWKSKDDLAIKVLLSLHEELMRRPKLIRRKKTYRVANSIYRRRLKQLSFQIKKLRKDQEREEEFFNLNYNTIHELYKFLYQRKNEWIRECVIAIEKYIPLDTYIQTGIEIDARLSSYLLEGIFLPYSALHDGATIVRDNRIVATACYLTPTLEFKYEDLDLGYRYAVEMCQITDSIIIVLSKMGDSITLAHNGKVYDDVKENEFENLIRNWCEIK